MILCSCNAISSSDIKRVVESSPRIPTVQEIMEKHRCSIECATCVRNIKEEIRKHYEDKV